MIAGQGRCRRARCRTMERRWRMVSSWNWRMNRGRMGTVGRRMWRSMEM